MLLLLLFCIFKDANYTYSGFPGGPDSEESARNAEDPGLIPGSGMATHSSVLT